MRAEVGGGVMLGRRHGAYEGADQRGVVVGK